MASTLELLRQMVPPPRIDDCRRVLCVQPHPDDTDIGAGATVARLARLGAEVHYLTVTDGSAGAVDPGLDRTRLTALRRQEQEQAARILGVRELRWLDYPDAGDYSEYRVRLDVIRAIRELRPDLLLTVDPWTPYESHPDHLICGRAVAAAALLHGFAAVGDADAAVDQGAQPRPLVGIAFYHTAHPNQYVAVDEEDWRRKWEAVACHRSQLDPATLEAYRLYFDTRAREHGEAAGVARAEAFKVLPVALLHCVAEAMYL